MASSDLKQTLCQNPEHVDDNNEYLHDENELSPFRFEDSASTIMYCKKCLEKANPQAKCFFCESFVSGKEYTYMYVHDGIYVCMECLLASPFSDETARNAIKYYFYKQRTHDGEKIIDAAIFVMLRRRRLNEKIGKDTEFDDICLRLSSTKMSLHTLLIDHFTSTIPPEKLKRMHDIVTARDSDVLFFQELFKQEE